MNQKLNYTPILKAKEGEFKALEVTNSSTLDQMNPIFEIVSIPWDYIDECESKTIDNHLDKVGKKIQESINERFFFLDSRYIDENKVMSNGVHHMEFLFEEFRNLGLNGIPVTGFSKMKEYKEAVKQIKNHDEKGICLRIESSELASKFLSNNIDDFLSYYNVSKNEVDIVIDLKNITSDEKDFYLLSLTTIINNSFPYINEWRNFIISATSFPQNLSEIEADSIDSIERAEWLLFNSLINNGLVRDITFSDYCIASSETTEMDPRFIQMSASVRYTYNNYWLIVRGRSVKTKGFIQFHNLCKNLIVRPEFSGAGFSWGDNYIFDCASNSVSSGNATTWRKVGSNHHFEFVVNQLSNLP